MNLWKELRRRNVFRVAGVYAVVGWLLMQVAIALESSLSLPDWFDGVVVSLLLIGFPVAVLLAWAFEMTPDGVQRTEVGAAGDSTAGYAARKLDVALVVSLLLLGAVVLGDRVLPRAEAPPNAVVAETPAAQGGISAAGDSIAVLPFEDFSPSADQGYFASGIAEELLNVLAKVDGLRVASRTSAFSFAGKDVSVSEIAKALGVDKVLEGSIRKAGSTLRITAQLIDASTDVHLWSETYDRPLSAENIFEIQDEIATAIVAELQHQIDVPVISVPRPTQSTEAYDAYLKGKELSLLRTVEGVDQGITELLRAVTLDPEFAVAHATLGFAYSLARYYANMPETSSLPRSSLFMQRAQALAPENGEVLSYYAWWLTEQVPEPVPFKQAVEGFNAAIAANPNNAEAYRGLGYLQFNHGQYEQARLAYRKAYALNPLSQVLAANLSGLASDMGDEQGSLEWSRYAFQLGTVTEFTIQSYAWSLFSAGKLVEAHRVLKAVESHFSSRLALAWVYTELGMFDLARRIDPGYGEFMQLMYLGERAQATQLIEASDEPPTIRFSGLVLAGATSQAYAVFLENESAFHAELDEFITWDLTSSDLELTLYRVLSSQGDSRAMELRERLTRKHAGERPEDVTNPSRLVLNARWALLSGEACRAMVWLQRLVDLELSNITALLDPEFDVLKSRGDYAAWRQRLEAVIADKRALIEQALEHPPEQWWSPDDVEPVKPTLP